LSSEEREKEREEKRAVFSNGWVKKCVLVAHSLSLYPFFLFFSLSHTLSQSLSHTLLLPLCLSVCLSLSLPLSHSFAPSLSDSLSLSHTHTHKKNTHCFALSLSLSLPTLAQARALFEPTAKAATTPPTILDECEAIDRFSVVEVLASQTSCGRLRRRRSRKLFPNPVLVQITSSQIERVFETTFFQTGESIFQKKKISHNNKIFFYGQVIL